MRFLIVDDSAAFRQALTYYLGVHWPDAPVDELVPGEDDFDIGYLEAEKYDTIFLGHPFRAEKAFESVRQLRAIENCPPVILFADPSNEFLAVDALKAGAASYFPKQQVRYKRLIDTVRMELGVGSSVDIGVRFIQQSGLRRRHQYRYLSTLHSGEFSSVYLAKDLADDTRMVFKVLRHVPDSGGDGLFDRFLQEYELVAGISHSNVVRIFDLGVADDHAFIAMEYLSHGSLAGKLNHKLAPETALSYCRDIASALAVIHEAGILHRDLKPSNIMFRDEDNIALIDFGLAKQMELNSALTGHGQIFGTPYYMSPEQGHGQDVDTRSDIYSLGCILYEMLTGERPFTSNSALGIIYKHANAPRPQLEDVLAPVSPVLEKMFARDARDRYSTAAALLRDLEDLL